MQTQNPMFDDFAKVLNGAAGTIAGMGREAEASMKARVKDWIGGLDFVSRDEFEAVKAMAAAARDEADTLRARLDKLEGHAAPSSSASIASGIPPEAAPLFQPAPTVDEVDG